MNSEQITAFLQEHWYIASVLIGAIYQCSCKNTVICSLFIYI